MSERGRKGRIVYTYNKSDGLAKAENEIGNIIRPMDTKRRLQAARRRYWALGHTEPKSWADRQQRQGGNVRPRNRKREYPSGHRNCGFYRP